MKARLEWLRYALPALILGLQAILLFTSISRASPIYDELFHLIRGLSAWWTGDTRLSFAHPPLGNALAALPAALWTAPYDISGHVFWAKANPGRIADAYFEHDYETARHALMLARGMIAAGAVLLSAYVYVWCLRAFGLVSAVAALLFVSMQPVMLAHGHFVTTDLLVALGVTLAAGEFVRYLEDAGWLRLLTLSLALGAAVSIKYTALVLLPLLPLLALPYAWRGRGRFAAYPRPTRMVRLGAEAVFAGLIALLCINASHGFQRTGWTAQELLTAPVPTSVDREGPLMQRNTPLSKLPESMPVPLPQPYLVGIAMVRAQARLGRPTYFMSQTRDESSWRYFPTMIVAQSLPASLVGLVLGLMLLARRRTWPSMTTITALAIAGVVLALGMRSNVNIGLRHILLVIPMLAILAGRGIGLAWEVGGAKRWVRPMLILLLATAPVTAIAAFPRYLGYYNLLVGGRGPGHQISLIGEDWGQDTIDLARWVEQNELSEVRYHPYTMHGLLELELLGVEARRLRCKKALPAKVLAVHAVIVMRGKCFPELELDGYDAHLNHHILIYDRRTK